MGYENAPQTKMLATHCAICSRPLCDSKSVEIGIGPDCREKYGYNIAVSDVARVAANQMVYQIAINQNEPELCMEYCNGLRELGFSKLAQTILSRIAVVVIEEEAAPVNGAPIGQRFSVQTPYDEQVIAAFRAVSGRRWDKANKVNTFPTFSKRAVLAVLSRFYAGKIAVGPKGGFIVPAPGGQVVVPVPLAAAPVQMELPNVCPVCKAVRCPDGCCCAC